MDAETAKQIQNIVVRVESLTADAQNIAEDIREVYKEAKAQGFDVATIRKIIALRKKDKDEIYEEDELLKTYRKALNI